MRIGKDASRHLLGIVSMAVLAGAFAAPCAARADEITTEHDLEQAEQALVNLDYEGANTQATQVWHSRGLTHEQLVRAARVVATTDAVLDREPQARDAFQLLLTYDPTYASDANLGPKVQAPFLEARGLMRAQPSQPGLEASITLRANEPATLRIVTRDPTHVGSRLLVAFRWAGDGPFQRTTLPMAGTAVVDAPPPPPAATRLDYFVQVLDDHDSAAFESGNAGAPKSAIVDLAPAVVTPIATQSEHRSVLASPIFWAIVGVAVVGAGTGVYLGTHKTNGTELLPATSASLLPGFKCNGGSC